jgi:hypothetical protein
MQLLKGHATGLNIKQVVFFNSALKFSFSSSVKRLYTEDWPLYYDLSQLSFNTLSDTPAYVLYKDI